MSARRLGGDRAGEIRITRFLRNPAVTTKEMVGEAAGRTAARCVGRHVLAIQDTSVVQPGARRGTGLFLHAVVAVDADDGAVLGLVDAELLEHRPQPQTPAAQTAAAQTAAKAALRITPFEEKESARWLRGARAAAHVVQAARVTVIADRESDVFALFEQRPDGVDLLVRAKHDRALGEGSGRMFAAVDAQPEAGRATIDLPAKPGRRARTAVLAVRWRRVEPVRPGAGGNVVRVPGGVPMILVDVREVDPPPGAETVHWRLLTTLPVTDAADAFVVADLYRRRWAIEQLFRTLKTEGFDIEGLNITAAVPRSRLVVAALIAAVIVQQLVHARDGTRGPSPLRPLTDAFDDADLPLLKAFTAKLQGKTERQKNPHPEGSLAYAAWVCARLGGWTGYYGKPGPITMLNGWLHFQAAKDGARLAANDV